MNFFMNFLKYDRYLGIDLNFSINLSYYLSFVGNKEREMNFLYDSFLIKLVNDWFQSFFYILY
jgi:hypothetical protein